MKLGIVQLPFNPDNLAPIITQAKNINCDFYLYDKKEKFEPFLEKFNPENVHYVDIDSYDVEKITEHAKDNKLDNVIAFAELGLQVAAQVRDKLSLPGHDNNTEQLSINKYAMRQRLSDKGLTHCRSTLTKTSALKDTLVQFGLPAIVKPVNLVGSICVELINDIAQVDNYIARLNENPYGKSSEQLLVESFIEGEEYSAEGLILGGQVYLYGVTEKRTTGAPYFVESGHSFYIKHDLRNELESYLPKLFSALDMHTCPFHVEFKHNNGCFEVIELHSRYGGGFITDLVEMATDNKVFEDYFNFLTSGKTPIINPNIECIASVEFIMAKLGKIEEYYCSDEVNADESIITIKKHFKPGHEIKFSTGFFERAARILFSSNNEQEMSITLNKIRNGFLVKQ